MRVDVDAAVDGWEGALRAVLAGAHSAAGSDRGGGGEVLEVEAAGVHGAVGVARFAAKADGEHFVHFAEPGFVVSHGA